MKNLLLIFILISSSLFSQSTKQYVEFTHDKPLPEGKARIYVSKPSFKGKWVKVAVFDNNTLIGNMRSGSYLAWDVDSGEHIIGNTQFAHAGTTLGSGAGEDLFKINAQAGKIYYLQIKPHFGGMSFELMDNDKGEKFFKNRKEPAKNYVE